MEDEFCYMNILSLTGTVCACDTHDHDFLFPLLNNLFHNKYIFDNKNQVELNTIASLKQFKDACKIALDYLDSKFTENLHQDDYYQSIRQNLECSISNLQDEARKVIKESNLRFDNFDVSTLNKQVDHLEQKTKELENNNFKLFKRLTIEVLSLIKDKPKNKRLLSCIGIKSSNFYRLIDEYKNNLKEKKVKLERTYNDVCQIVRRERVDALLKCIDIEISDTKNSKNENNNLLKVRNEIDQINREMNDYKINLKIVRTCIKEKTEWINKLKEYIENIEMMDKTKQLHEFGSIQEISASILNGSFGSYSEFETAISTLFVVANLTRNTILSWAHFIESKVKSKIDLSKPIVDRLILSSLSQVTNVEHVQILKEHSKDEWTLFMLPYALKKIGARNVDIYYTVDIAYYIYNDAEQASKIVDDLFENKFQSEYLNLKYDNLLSKEEILKIKPEDLFFEIAKKLIYRIKTETNVKVDCIPMILLKFFLKHDLTELQKIRKYDYYGFKHSNKFLKEYFERFKGCNLVLNGHWGKKWTDNVDLNRYNRRKQKVFDNDDPEMKYYHRD